MELVGDLCFRLKKTTVEVLFGSLNFKHFKQKPLKPTHHPSPQKPSTKNRPSSSDVPNLRGPRRQGSKERPQSEPPQAAPAAPQRLPALLDEIEETGGWGSKKKPVRHSRTDFCWGLNVNIFKVAFTSKI